MEGAVSGCRFVKSDQFPRWQGMEKWVERDGTPQESLKLHPLQESQRTRIDPQQEQGLLSRGVGSSLPVQKQRDGPICLQRSFGPLIWPHEFYGQVSFFFGGMLSPEDGLQLWHQLRLVAEDLDQSCLNQLISPIVASIIFA